MTRSPRRPRRSPHQVHDGLFKQVLGEPARAAAELCAVLPADAAARIDWQRLQAAPANFVDRVFQQSYGDLVFHAPFQGGGEALLWFLLEHQSTMERWMALRVVNGQNRMWHHWRALHPERERLPAIVPVVVYHGAQPWDAPRCIAGLLGLPPDMPDGLARHVLSSCFVLDDLTVVTDEALRARRLDAFTALGLLALAHGRARDIFERLRAWHAELRAVLVTAEHREHGAALLSYLCIVNPDLDVEIMREYLTNEIGPEVEETVMTAGERLIQQGYDKGFEEAQRDTLCAALLKLLDQRFGRLPAAVESRIEAAGAEDLERWLDRVIAARSLDDVFAIG
jgi:hypothetical protein